MPNHSNSADDALLEPVPDLGSDGPVIDISGLDLTQPQLVVMRLARHVDAVEAGSLAQQLSVALQQATGGMVIPALVLSDDAQIDAIDAEDLHSLGLARLSRVVSYLDAEADASHIPGADEPDPEDVLDHAARAIEDGTYLR